MNKLIFEDSFNYNGSLDQNKWNYEIGGHGWGNNEIQYYTDSLDNAIVKDGMLTINIIKQRKGNNEYTSSKITTYGKKSFKYGSFRVSCKLPTEKGLWPAIWLLPNTYKDGERWPRCGEIDLLEMVTREKGRMVYSLHSQEGNFKKGNQLTKIVFSNKYNDFCEYRMDWTKDYFEYFLDGESVARIDRIKNANYDNWPFDKEYYLIINVAMGGLWCQNPDETFQKDKMEIKYVKVYEIDED